MSPLNRLLLLAMLAPTFLSASEAVVVADPELNAVYYRNRGDGEGRPTLLSASTSIQADMFAWLAAGQAVFKPQDSGIVASINLESGDVELIYEPMEGHVIVAVDGGPDPDTATILTYETSTHTINIHSGTRAAAKWEWVTSDASMTTNVGQPDYNYFRVLRLDATRVAIAANGATPQGVFLLDTSVPVTASSLLSTSEIHRLHRGPAGSFIADPARPGFTGVLSLFDVTGTLLGTISRNSAGPFFNGTRSTAALWNATAPEIQAVSPFGLVESDDPLAPPYSSNQVYNFRNGAGSDTQIDLSGAENLLTSGDDWWIHNKSLGVTAHVDVSEDNQARHLLFQMGDGPPFHEIADVAVGDDGNVYVLDNLPVSARIMKLDRVTGDRTIVADLPPGGCLPRLEVLETGELMIGRWKLTLRPELGANLSHYQLTLEKIALGGVEPVVTPWAGQFLECPLQDWVTLPDDAVAIIPNQAQLPTIFVATEDGTTSAPITRVPAESVTQVSTEVCDVTFQVSANAFEDPANRAYFQFQYEEDFGLSLGPRIVSVTAPGGEICPGVPAATVLYHLEGDDVLSLNTAVVPLATASDLAGKWTVRVEPLDRRDLRTAFISPLYTAKGVSFASDPDGLLCIAESNPAAIARRNPMEEIVTSRILLAGEEGVDPERIAHIESSEAPGKLYATLANEPGAVQIDLTTGSVSRFLLGKPSAVDTRLTGTGNPIGLRIAVSPMPFAARSTTVGWRLY